LNVKLIWQEILNLLKQELSEIIFNTWIKNLKPLYIKNNCLILLARENFVRQVIHKRYLKKIIKFARIITRSNMTVKIIITKKKNYKTLNNKYSFKNFILGSSNELAYRSALSIAEGINIYNPLCLYGDTGLGKTHLLFSIGNHVLNKFRDKKIIYISSENFTNELINSIKNKTNQEFRNKYRELDLLLIDDIDFIFNKKITQQEIFFTFNALLENNKQIVLTSNQEPKKIKTLEPKLSSRFESGLLVEITQPDFETRVKILENKLSAQNLFLSREIINFIAQNIYLNIRELESALNKLIAQANLINKNINLELAKKILNINYSCDINFIKQIIAKYFNLELKNLNNKSRKKNIITARQIAIYLSRKLTNMTYKQIAESFDRDHSTIIYTCDKINYNITHDQKLKNIILLLEKKIRDHDLL